MKKPAFAPSRGVCKLAGLVLVVCIWGLLAANIFYMFQDGMGDDFWGGLRAPRLRPTSAGEGGLASYDVRAGALNCPRFIGADEVSTVRLRVYTRSARDETAKVMAFISQPDALEGAELSELELPLAPESERIQTWEIGPQNVRTDGTIRLRVYVGNKYQALMSDVRGCTVRRVQIGPIGGEAAGYGLFVLVLMVLWGSFALWQAAACQIGQKRKVLSARRGLAVAITLMSLINFFGGGLIARVFVLLGILALVSIAVQPALRSGDR